VIVDLLRRHLFAARLDDVVHPRDEVQVALLVEAAVVAGVEDPLAGQRARPELLRRRLRLLPVAFHDRRPPDHELTDLRGAAWSSTIHSSVLGMAMPTLVGLRSMSSGGRYVQRLHSVSPYIENTRAELNVRLRNSMCLLDSAAAVLVTKRTPIDRNASRARQRREDRRHAETGDALTTMQDLAGKANDR
jgi:hypothetical protein